MDPPLVDKEGYLPLPQGTVLRVGMKVRLPNEASGTGTV